MAMLFWYLVKRALPSVGYCTVYSHFIPGNRKTRSCLTGHPVIILHYLSIKDEGVDVSTSKLWENHVHDVIKSTRFLVSQVAGEVDRQDVM